MKKKLLCLLLCLATIFAACMLGGCSEEEEIDTNNNSNTSRNAVTINMWIISENKVSAETEAAVEAAFNEVSKSKYTTNVDLIFCTEEEYKAKVDAQLDKSANRPTGTPIKPATKGDEYERDEDMMWVLKYPETTEYQMDIVLITSENMLREYVGKGYLKSLNNSLTTTYKIINRYIYNDIIDNAKIDGEWFAVPNNQIIGEYTFMMVNRAAAEAYGFKESDFTSFGAGTPAAALIDQIAANNAAGAEKQIAPMYGMAEYPLVKYWNKNGDAKSILSTMYLSANVECGKLAPTVSNLFADANYKSFMQQMMYCKENGYFRTTEDEFGVGIFTGDYSLAADYSEDYYVIPLFYPRLEDTDVFSSMFAITNYTVDEQRSMEIIKDLTCDSELRNILQYGVLDQHYTLDEEGALKRLNHDYMMNIAYTGNMLMAYPEEGMPLNIWEVAKEQNLVSRLSLTFGATNSLNTVDQAAWQEMSDISAAYFGRLSKCETVNEFLNYMDAAAKEIASTSYYKQLTSSENSLSGALSKWFTDNFAQ